MTDPSEPAAYPITTLTWMLFYRAHGNDAIAAALRDFVTLAIGEEGQAMAADLSFLPLPEVLVEPATMLSLSRSRLRMNGLSRT